MYNPKFNAIFLATAAALLSQPALANPESYTHQNGSTVVNINKADGSGLSHNIWSSLNVSDKGLILNNSLENILHEKGNIGKNSNLDRAAKIILNEVVSNNSSSLNGFIAIAGQKADVIIANPNGITCSGCSFINTGRTTLTTGSPAFNDGMLTGFDITKGNITVKNKGLQNADYVDLLAQTITIQGMIEAAGVKAVAGTYQYTLADSAVTANPKTRQGTAIDVSALGGATAGIIQLQTTEAGAGVNNQGILTASALSIDTNGALINSGTINASLITATSTGKLDNRGKLSGQQMQLASGNTVTNSGIIETSGQIDVLSMGKIMNGKRANINAGGDIQLISYRGDIENRGEIATLSSVYAQSGFAPVEDEYAAVANTSVINSGSMRAAGDIRLIAVKEVALKSADLTAGGDASFTAAKVSNKGHLLANNITLMGNEIENGGAIVAANDLTITGNQWITNNGSLTARTLSLASEGLINNRTCSWYIFCQSGIITAEKMTVIAPKMSSITDIGGDLRVNSVEMNKPAEPADKV